MGNNSLYDIVIGGRASKRKILEIRVDELSGIEYFLQERGIKNLLHFTLLDNLMSILENGLIPVNEHDIYGIKSVTNDSNRFDARTECTSFSIGFPNYKLFYKFRKRVHPNKQWVILAINPEIILDPDRIVLFCSTNAAKQLSKGFDEALFCKVDAFRKMYSDTGKNLNKEIVLREDLDIERYMTTDPQAELLVSDKIEVKYITNVYFDNKVVMNNLLNSINIGEHLNIEFQLEHSLFRYRNDFTYWR